MPPSRPHIPGFSSSHRDRFHGRAEAPVQGCDAPGCAEAGEFRAPPDTSAADIRRDGPGHWRWFCLDHIRAFNQSYNFFNGMSPEEIYEAQKPMAGWDTETRAFATNGGAAPSWTDFKDPIDAIGAKFRDNIRERAAVRADGGKLSANDRKAFKTLGLAASSDRRAVRRRYSELVRRYHPDKNGGDRAHEKVLADVIWAYTQLKDSLGRS